MIIPEKANDLDIFDIDGILNNAIPFNAIHPCIIYTLYIGIKLTRVTLSESRQSDRNVRPFEIIFEHHESPSRLYIIVLLSSLVEYFDFTICIHLYITSMSNSPDPLKNGSIFKLKNLRAIRSPNNVIKGTNSSPGSSSKAVTFNSDVKDNASSINTTDPTALIKQRFDQIYRATPLPSVLFNNSQFTLSNHNHNHNQNIHLSHQNEQSRQDPILSSAAASSSSSSSPQPQISSSLLRDRINHQQQHNHNPTTQYITNEQAYDNNDDNYTNDDNDYNDNTIANGNQYNEKLDIPNDKIINNGTNTKVVPKRGGPGDSLRILPGTGDSLRFLPGTPPSKRIASKSPGPQGNNSTSKNVVAINSDSKKATSNSKKGLVDSISDEDVKSKAKQKAGVTKKKISKTKAKDIDYDDDSEYSGETRNKTTRSGRKSQPVNRLTDDELRSPNKSLIPLKRKESSSDQGDKKWEPSELSILYRVHAVTDPTAPDFWALVSAGIKEMGVIKSAEACQDQWYQSMLEARERRNKKIAKDKNLGQNNDDEIITDIPEQENVKKRKLNRAEIQQLAQKSARAEKDDDIFDELSTRYSATETQNHLAQALELIKSPGADAKAQISNTDDNDISNNNKWKATYVHNLSKKVKNSIAVKSKSTTANKVSSSITVPKTKKITEGKVSAALSPSGRVRMSVKKLDSDDELDENDDEGEDDD